MFFTDEEKTKLDTVLKDLNLDNKVNVVTIDARPKVSASKAEGEHNNMRIGELIE